MQLRLSSSSRFSLEVHFSDQIVQPAEGYQSKYLSHAGKPEGPCCWALRWGTRVHFGKAAFEIFGLPALAK